MAYVKRELQFNTGDRIAQLLLFPYIKGKAAPVERTGGFGSTGKWQQLMIKTASQWYWHGSAVDTGTGVTVI